MQIAVKNDIIYIEIKTGRFFKVEKKEIEKKIEDEKTKGVTVKDGSKKIIIVDDAPLTKVGK